MPRNYKKKQDSRETFYSQEMLKKAISLVKEKNVSSYEASRRCGVPRGTIARHVAGIKCHKIGEGRPTYLTLEEERYLVIACKSFAEFGFPLTKTDLMDFVQQFVLKIGKQHLFPAGQPKIDWYTNFMKRWSKDISVRTPELLTLTRALSCNETVVNAWFTTLERVLSEYQLFEKPAQILNCDETGLSTNPKITKIICRRGQKNPVNIAPGSGKEQYTVLSTISAGGRNYPPFILYSAKNLYHDWMEGGPPGALYGVTANGWMESEVFSEYLACLVKWVESVPKPVLLIYDGHMSHVSLKTVEIARENGIMILCLPAHCSHLLQPLDVGIFKQGKETWRRILKDWYKESKLKAVSKNVFPKLVAQLYRCAFKPSHIVSSFSKCGIFPFDPSAVSKEKLAPSKIFERDRVSIDDQNLNLESTGKDSAIVAEATCNPSNPTPGPSSGSTSEQTTPKSKAIRETIIEQLKVSKGDARAAKPRRKVKRAYGGECLTSDESYKRMKDSESNKVMKGNSAGKGKGKGKGKEKASACRQIFVSAANEDAGEQQHASENSNSCVSCGKEWFSDTVSNQEQWLDCDQCNVAWTCAGCIPQDFDHYEVFFCEICKGL